MSREHVDALIFVIDSSDMDRLELAKKELHRVVNEEHNLEDAAILIFANKQDLPTALTTSKIIQKLDLMRLHNHQWNIQPCCTITGEGLYEGLDWLNDTVKE